MISLPVSVIRIEQILRYAFGDGFAKRFRTKKQVGDCLPALGFDVKKWERGKRDVEQRSLRSLCEFASKFARYAFGDGFAKRFRTKKQVGDCLPAFLVRKTGLEPVQCELHAPQTCASTSSATSAYRTLSCATYVIIHFFLKMSIPF